MIRSGGVIGFFCFIYPLSGTSNPSVRFENINFNISGERVECRASINGKSSRRRNTSVPMI